MRGNPPRQDETCMSSLAILSLLMQHTHTHTIMFTHVHTPTHIHNNAHTDSRAHIHTSSIVVAYRPHVHTPVSVHSPTQAQKDREQSHLVVDQEQYTLLAFKRTPRLAQPVPSTYVCECVSVCAWI